MLEFIGWFVQHPARILVLGAVYVLAWFVLRAGLAGRRAGASLIPASFCVLFAAWEWLVLVRTPGANIRVDLLFIWLALLVLTVWSIWRALRH